MNDRQKRVGSARSALANAKLNALSALRDKHDLRLEGAGTDAVTAWFLGPKGENGQLLRRLVDAALKSHLEFRHDVYPADPRFITAKMQQAPEYKRSVKKLEREFESVLGALRESGAFFSMRSQGHMLWDVTIPGLAGYFAAMLYNQNNVAAEASPVTTMMEIAVGDDLCRMLGFAVPTAARGARATSAPRPWGHITCDGSIANMEGLWMARNLKFYPSALLAAARANKAAAPILKLQVPLLNGDEKKLADCTAWELLNLPIDAVLGLPALVQKETGIEAPQLAAFLSNHTVSALGMAGACNEYILKRGLEHLPVMTAPVTNHYSWPKGAAVLGLGTNQLWTIRVDLEARQEVDLSGRYSKDGQTLRGRLQQALATKTPVLAVVAIMGSTEESAVDPLHDIVKLRDELREQGMEFTIHADAAWGGYFASTLHPAQEKSQPRGRGAAFRSTTLPLAQVLKAIPETPMNADMIERYIALREADSVTVDPHKAGYIPYPAGALCYRNSDMRNLVSLKSPVVFHGDADPTVGVFGIEGSKPGAAAAAVYMSHTAIRPTREGYGKILEQCIFSSKKLYCRLRTMARPDDPFCIAFVQRLPAEKEGRSPAEVAQQLNDVRRWFVGKSNDEIVHGEHYDFFRQLGSDQTILSWAVNFKKKDGTWNQDVVALNALNDALYRTFSMMPLPDGKLKKPSDVELIVTSSDFAITSYGRDFVHDFLARLGIETTAKQLNDPALPAVAFNISTQMDPWFTETAGNPQDGFLQTIEDIIRTEILKQVKVAWRA